MKSRLHSFRTAVWKRVRRHLKTEYFRVPIHWVVLKLPRRLAPHERLSETLRSGHDMYAKEHVCRKQNAGMMAQPSSRLSPRSCNTLRHTLDVTVCMMCASDFSPPRLCGTTVTDPTQHNCAMWMGPRGISGWLKSCGRLRTPTIAGERDHSNDPYSLKAALYIPLGRAAATGPPGDGHVARKRSFVQHDNQCYRGVRPMLRGREGQRTVNNIDLKPCPRNNTVLLLEMGSQDASASISSRGSPPPAEPLF
jgi:hypothetical protein